MRELPILFNTAMVQAILKGSKTQTRRIVKPQPEVCDDDRGGHWWPSNVVQSMVHVEKELQDYEGFWGGLIDDCNPFGAKGDRLWVRETWHVEPDVEGWSMNDNEPCTGWIGYKAGGSKKVTAPNFDAVQRCFPKGEVDWDFVPNNWRPSIFMPRWACRLILEITNIRIERLNDISEVDAIAEGVEQVAYQHQKFWKGYKNKERAYRDTAKDGFTSLWKEINGVDSWATNPWVWVIEFKVIEVK
ncbi:hypothetical protein GWP85_17080 [Acinetobacter beijerinckii]|uniref:hypothetical protein n=1 Tax=Acinetobacter beijerinckii TaxID=262668 RepID=UPI0023DDE331|nr:hypothetical protein [Acinetobacter beijerinckii]MDF2419207.1 hypothetical protein [Acinetobacter beijerinckii]